MAFPAEANQCMFVTDATTRQRMRHASAEQTIPLNCKSSYLSKLHFKTDFFFDRFWSALINSKTAEHPNWNHIMKIFFTSFGEFLFRWVRTPAGFKINFISSKSSLAQGAVDLVS